MAKGNNVIMYESASLKAFLLKFPKVVIMRYVPKDIG